MLDDVFVQLLKRCGLDGKKNQCPTLHFLGDVASILLPVLIGMIRESQFVQHFEALSRMQSKKTALAVAFWDGREDNEAEIARATSLYGGLEADLPLKKSGEVVNVLRAIDQDLVSDLDQRETAKS